MNLTRYLDSLHRQLLSSAEAGGHDARAVAERLTGPLESAGRLMLLEVLSAAAEEITRELAPGSVDVRLRGREPEFVVNQTAASEPSGDGRSEGDTPTLGEAVDGTTSRMTLRLPEQLKTRVEQAAARDGLSVNAWLVRALAASLEPGDERRSRRRSPPGSQRYTGWVR